MLEQINAEVETTLAIAAAAKRSDCGLRVDDVQISSTTATLNLSFILPRTGPVTPAELAEIFVRLSQQLNEV